MNTRETMDRISGLLKAVSSGVIHDADEFVRVLDELVSEIRLDYPGLSDILDSVKEYIATSSGLPDGEAVEAIVSVLDACELVLMGESEEDTLGKLEGAVFFSRKEDCESDFRQRLNSLALALVQAEPGKGNSFGKTSDLCVELCRDDELDETVKDVLAKACQNLKKLSGPKKSGLKKLYSEACSLVEQALQLYEEQAAVTAGTLPDTASDSAETELQEESSDGLMLPRDTDQVLLEKYISECSDLLERAEHSLLILERTPGDKEALNSVFRSFHTIKGSSSFLGVPFMCELAHDAESLLHKVRENEIPFSNNIADLALRSADTLKTLLTNVQRSISANLPVAQPPEYGELLHSLTHHQSADRKADPQSDIPESETAPDSSEQTQSPARTVSEDASVRIRTDRLDRLIDMVGELVIAQSMISQDAAVSETQNFNLRRKTVHAGKIVRDLQDLSLSLRMVPLKSTFLRMSRLVRDLSFKTGKEILFTADGEDTEIDRNMVDYINDPLIHIIRNSVDHGIETADERIRSGKPEAASISLSAYSAGGNIVVEISDDGKGLQKERILAKAVKTGLIESGKGLSDRDIFNLVFEPGFSTSDSITDISGRGVGLDVVKKNVEALRGSVEITSERGAGTCFSLRLPLTLAITDGMLIRAGMERFIMPTVNIQLSVKPDPADISTVAHKGEMYRSRDGLIPIIRLHRLFDIPEAVTDLKEGLIIIVSSNENRFALFVDDLLGQQQVVIKTLGSGVGKVGGISGGAILGDGRVGLILDPAGLWDVRTREEYISLTAAL